MDRWHRLEDAILEIEQFARNEERQRIDHHVLNLEAKLVLGGKRNEDLLRKLEVEREVASRLEQDCALLRAENGRLRSSLIGLQREEILQSCREGELRALEGVFGLGEVDRGDEGQEVKNEALRIAASEGFLDVCELLLAQGADPVGRESANGQNALHRAVSALGHSDAALHLLIQGADAAFNVRARINEVDLHGQSPLSLAVRLLRVDRVLCLLSFGAETGMVSKEDWQRLNDFQAHQEPNDESPVLANLPTAAAAAASLVKDCSLFQQGRFEEALQACAGAGNWTQCARCCGSLGRHCEAVEFANRALELTPGSAAALLQRAESRLQVYDFEGAAGDFANLGMEDRAEEARRGLREKSEDLYSVLGVPDTATNLDVRKGFLRQCLRWHPDKNRQSRDDEARAGFMFKQVNDAHSVLMDAAKRRDYDAMCLETQQCEEDSCFEGEEEEEGEEYDENRQGFFHFLQSKTFSPK